MRNVVQLGVVCTNKMLLNSELPRVAKWSWIVSCLTGRDVPELLVFVVMRCSSVENSL